MVNKYVGTGNPLGFDSIITTSSNIVALNKNSALASGYGTASATTVIDLRNENPVPMLRSGL